MSADNNDAITDHDVLFAMRIYGGAFVKALATAAMHADRENMERIKTAFPEYWTEYEKLAPHAKTLREN
jgi:hypothetical protein